MPAGVGYGAIPPGVFDVVERLRGKRMQTTEQQQRGAKPDASPYGVMPQAYATALANKTNDPLFGSAYLMALKGEQEGALDAYDEALIRAQAGAEQITGMEQAGELAKANVTGYYGAFKDITDAGLHNQIEGGLKIDPVSGMASNATAFARRDADIRKDNAAANKANYESGMPINPQLAANRDASPRDLGEIPAYNVFPNQINPGDAAAQTQADAATTRAGAAVTAAEAAMYRAKNPPARGGGSDMVTVVTEVPIDPRNPMAGTRKVTTKVPRGAAQSDSSLDAMLGNM